MYFCNWSYKPRIRLKLGGSNEQTSDDRFQEPVITAVVLIVVLGITMMSRASAQTFNDVPAAYWASSFIETLAGTGNAQDTTANLLGKMLRVDIDGDDFPGDPNVNYAIPPANPFVGEAGDDEIWSFGLRNPWRASLDRTMGDLYIGDVGQNAREEINIQLSSSTGGENYGWRLREGTIATPTGGVGGPHPSGAIDPIYDYTQGGGPNQGNAVIGGFVYRGPIAAINGMYFFADNGNHRIWSLEFDGSTPSEFDGSNYFNFIDWTDLISTDIGTVSSITSFGEDADGNLYVLDGAGEIFIIDSATFE
jgi:hypothetical protein